MIHRPSVSGSYLSFRFLKEQDMSASSTTQPKTRNQEFIALLRCKNGISIAELAAAMNWKPHTTRAALTRLRQGGCTIEKLDPASGERASRYRIAKARS